MEDDDLLGSVKSFFVPLTSFKALHILVIVGILIFFNGLFNGFVSDDNTIVLNNPTVHSVSNIPKLFFENKYDTTGQNFLGGRYYRPITDSTFALNYGLFGANAFPFHLFQILLCIINACLLFFILKHFFKVPLALGLSLVFLLHPINSETAFYISSVQEVLFFFFGSLAFLLMLKYDSQKALIAMTACLLFSLLSKESGILFFAMVLLYIWLYKKKLFLPAFGYSTFAFVTYGLLRLLVLGNPVGLGAHSPMERLSLGERVLNIPAILFYYLKTFIYPFDLATSYQWTVTQLTMANFYLPLAFVIGFFLLVSSVGFLLYQKKAKTDFRLYCFFSLWFLLGVGLHLQVYPLDQTVAERWFYFPIVGLICMLGVFIDAWKIKCKSHWVIIFFVCLLSLYAMKVVLRSIAFRNDMTLVQSDMTVSKDSYSLEYIQSGLYLSEGRFEEAKLHAERSTALFPTLANYNNLGVIYLNMGNYPMAHKAFLRSLQYGEDYLPYENLANLALVYGDPNENIEFLTKTVLKKYPENGNAWMTLAILEYTHGDKKQARLAIQNAARYVNAPQIPFIADVIAKDLPLQVKVNNGQVSFETTMPNPAKR